MSERQRLMCLLIKTVPLPFRTLKVIANKLLESGVTVPVRCKDCKNRDDITGECKHPKAVGWDVIVPEDNDFCSYGERKR